MFNPRSTYRRLDSKSGAASQIELQSNFTSTNSTKHGVSPSSRHGPVQTTQNLTSTDGSQMPGGDRAGEDADALSKVLWTPLVLRQRIIWSFTAVFLALATTIVILWRVSKNAKGLVPVQSKYYYIWAYGPTAVFTIVSALWGQVEHRTLQLFPWRLMSHGYVTASNSLLLDYLSDWNVWALLKALKRRHFMVAIVISVSLLIKMMTAFSTGLFAAVSVHVDHNTEFRLLHDFDGTKFDHSDVDARVYMQSWGIRDEGLSSPLGITSDEGGYHAFQAFYDDSEQDDKEAFQAVAYLPNRTYVAPVDIFTPELHCEEAIAITSDDSNQVRLETANCSAEIQPQTTNTFTYLGLILASCHGVTSNAYEWRVWTYVAVDSDSDRGQPVMSYNETEYVDFVAVMCTLDYRTTRGEATFTGNSDVTKPSVSLTIGEPSNILGLQSVTASDILYTAYLSAVQAAESYIAMSEEFLILGVDWPTRTRLFDVGNLTAAVTESVNCLSALVAHNYLLKSSNDRTEGTLSFSETRLVVRDLSAWAVVSLLVLLALLASVLNVCYLPCAVSPRDPGSVAGIATFLSSSSRLVFSLAGTGSTTNEELERLLATDSYTTEVTRNSFCIKQHEGRSHPNENVESNLHWWRPFSASWWSRTAILSSPIILVVVLEVVYQSSTSHDGIANLSLNSNINSATTYIPALVMLTVRTLFETVYFAARVFQPYHNLKRGHAKASTSIMDNQHRKIAVAGVWNALCRQQWAVVTAGTAVLIAPLLPIVVSGLYTTADTTTSTQVTLNQLNRVNISDGYFITESQRSQAAWLGDLVLEFNSSSPRWTYQQYSFPKLELSVDSTETPYKGLNSTDVPLNDFYLETRLPALHVNLSCEAVAPDDFNAQVVQRNSQSEIGLNFTQLGDHDGAECGYAGGSIETSVPVSNGFFNLWEAPSGYSVTNFDAASLPSTCPSIIAAYGQMSSGTSSIAKMVVLKCRPRVEQTDVDVRLRLLNYDLDLSKTPSPVPGSTTVLYDGYMGGLATSRSEPVVPSGFGPYFADLTVTDPLTADLEELFRSMIQGVNGTSADDLLDPSHLAAALQHNVGILMAQLITSFGREDYTLNETAVPVSERPTYAATLNNPFRRRIVQHEISTRILQGMLLAMCACGALSIFLMDTRAVLPKNPMSIAAIGSLLADSSLVRNSVEANGAGVIPAGAEWCSDQELRRRGVFEGRTYTMGWWSRDRQEEAEYDAPGQGQTSDSDGANIDGTEEDREVMVSQPRVFTIDADP